MPRRKSGSEEANRQQRARRQGRAAYLRGKGRDDYAPDTKGVYGMAAWWQTGWDEAECLDALRRIARGKPKPEEGGEHGS